MPQENLRQTLTAGFYIRSNLSEKLFLYFTTTPVSNNAPPKKIISYPQNALYVLECSACRIITSIIKFCVSEIFLLI